MPHISRFISLLIFPALCLLSACQSLPTPSGLKLGKPYTVEGRTYYPEYDPTYDKIGMASWYGPGFHGKYTASGEVFNQNDLTAAHPTLPMPSIVRVTNLANGRSLLVRINDRGPFKSNRIIDLSKKSAQTLGITSTAEVRVQYLKQETEEYAASLPNGGASLKKLVAMNSNTSRVRDESILRSTEPASSDQIVENTVSSTHTGQTVTDAAPVMTVKSDDLNDASKKKITSDDSDAVQFANNSPKAEARHGLIKQAWADDKLAPLAPPQAVDDTNSAKKKGGAVDLKIPPKSLKTTEQPGYFIQAGSFSTEDNAHKLSTKLASAGPTDVGKVEAGAKTWWRVRVGPYGSSEESNPVRDKLNGMGIKPTLIKTSKS